MEKELTIVDAADAKTKIDDLVIVGNVDMFKLLCKASSKSQGWMKSCKALSVDGGCIVQVTTQQYSRVAEAICFVPGVSITIDVNGGHRLYTPAAR